MGRRIGAENPQGGRLAGTVGAEQPKDFAFEGVESHAIQRYELSASQIRVALRQILDMDHLCVPRRAVRRKRRQLSCDCASACAPEYSDHRPNRIDRHPRHDAQQPLRSQSPQPGET